MPQSSWTCIGTDDLGEIADNCELCGQDIRYVFAIEHPSWSPMAVGTDCCDRLTGNSEASTYHDAYLKRVDARKRFVGSKRWKTLANGDFRIRQQKIDVVIKKSASEFLIFMDQAEGKGRYGSLLEAKIRAFDTINSGEAREFLDRRRDKRNKKLQEQIFTTHGVRIDAKFLTDGLAKLLKTNTSQDDF